MKALYKRPIIAGALLCFVAVTTALAYSFNQGTEKEDKWADLDNFKAELPAKLQASMSTPGSFNLQKLGDELAQFRIDEMPVCATDEISADQYIELSDVSNGLDSNPGVTMQLKKILETDKGISDCQFRVLAVAISKPRQLGK
ncbi:hypothetical protein ACI77O_12995 [Pseudomonas tritici]|uniref:hypothetical protein n=1 Tax=Pseudomonas tritici TaxID=2745518 RepID=UPI00387B117D